MQTPVPDTDSLPVADPQADSLSLEAYNESSQAPNGATRHVAPTPLPDTDPAQDGLLPPPHLIFQQSPLSSEPERRKVKRSPSTSPHPDSPQPKSFPRTPPTPPDRVTLTVRDKENNEFTFQVKRSTPFRKVFEAFSQKMKEPVKAFRFLYDGKRISESDTPVSLGVENGDSIDAMVMSQGGQYQPRS
ncbi:unnamed protein product [Agarophyton chilense]